MRRCVRLFYFHTYNCHPKTKNRCLFSFFFCCRLADETTIYQMLSGYRSRYQSSQFNDTRSKSQFYTAIFKLPTYMQYEDNLRRLLHFLIKKKCDFFHVTLNLSILIFISKFSSYKICITNVGSCYLKLALFLGLVAASPTKCQPPGV